MTEVVAAREATSSLEVHRNGKGEIALTVKVYFDANDPGADEQAQAKVKRIYDNAYREYVTGKNDGKND